MIETEVDCANEIARLLAASIHSSWMLAAIDVVRHENEVADFRAFYLEKMDCEKMSVDLSFELKSLLRRLARLASSDEKVLYKKLRFTLRQTTPSQLAYKLDYNYDDLTPGFLGSNGVLVDVDFFERPGPD